MRSRTRSYTGASPPRAENCASMRRTTASAACGKPCVTSQRGLSGIQSRMTKITSPIVAPIRNASPLADRRIDECRIEQDERTARAHCRAKPEAAVDEEVGPAAEPRRDKLLDCRIDGSVFAADAGAGEKAEPDKTPRIPRQARGRGCREINDKRDREQFFAAKPIGQPAEEDRTEHGTDEITASGKADLRIAQPQSRALLEFAGQRAGQRHFEPIENPGDAQRDDHQEVKSPERQGVKPRRDIGGDDGARWAGSGVSDRVPGHRGRNAAMIKI